MQFCYGFSTGSMKTTVEYNDTKRMYVIAGEGIKSCEAQLLVSKIEIIYIILKYPCHVKESIAQMYKNLVSKSNKISK